MHFHGYPIPILEWEIRPIGFHQPNYRHTFIHFLKMALNPFRAHQSICKKYSWMPSLECDKGQMGLIKVSTRFFLRNIPKNVFETLLIPPTYLGKLDPHWNRKLDQLGSSMYIPAYFHALSRKMALNAF